MGLEEIEKNGCLSINSELCNVKDYTLKPLHHQGPWLDNGKAMTERLQITDAE